MFLRLYMCDKFFSNCRQWIYKAGHILNFIPLIPRLLNSRPESHQEIKVRFRFFFFFFVLSLVLLLASECSKGFPDAWWTRFFEY